LGDALAVAGAGQEAGLAGVGEVAALDEDAGDVGIPGEAEAAAGEAAIVAAGGDAVEAGVHAFGETVAVHTPPEGLGAIERPGTGVQVDADEHGIAILPGEGDAGV
jgi:hypothetical protein